MAAAGAGGAVPKGAEDVTVEHDRDPLLSGVLDDGAPFGPVQVMFLAHEPFSRFGWRDGPG